MNAPGNKLRAKNMNYYQNNLYTKSGLFVRLRGEGPLLVLLHNGFDSGESWQSLEADLVQSGFALLSWDRSGYGKSALKKGFSLSDDLLDAGCGELDEIFASPEVQAFRSQQTAKDSLICIGHCFGGALALEWTLRSGLPKGLVLEGTGFFSDADIRRRTDWILQAWENIEPKEQEHLKQMHGERAQETWNNVWPYRACYVMASDYDLRPRLKDIRCPSLIIQGSKDFFFSPDHPVKTLPYFPKAKLSLVPGGSHNLHEDHPKEWLKEVLDFLASV